MSEKVPGKDEDPIPLDIISFVEALKNAPRERRKVTLPPLTPEERAKLRSLRGPGIIWEEPPDIIRGQRAA